MARAFYRVDAFADRLFGGNPACVVPDARGLDEAAMRVLARELNAAATAFVLPPTLAECTHRVRFFKPNGQELAACGHATVATFAVLAVRGEVGARAVMECGAGVVPVGISFAAAGVRVAMEQGAGRFEAIGGAVDQALGLEASKVIGGERATTGGAWITLVALRDVDAVQACKPDARALAALGAERVYAFTMAGKVDGRMRAHARFFVVDDGRVDEDPVTGTAAGALAAWLHRRGVIARDETLVVEQGIECHRPGTIEASVGEDARVTIRGGAVMVLEGSIEGAAGAEG